MDYSLQVSAFVCGFIFWLRSHLYYGVHDRLLFDFISKLGSSRGFVEAFRVPSDCTNQLVLSALNLAADLIVSADLVCIPHSDMMNPAEENGSVGKQYLELSHILIELRKSHCIRYFWLRCHLADSAYSALLEELAHNHPRDVEIARRLVRLRDLLAFSK